MAQPKQLWRTTIVIWTDYDPSDLEIDDLAREAVSGDAYCNHQTTETITNQSLFPGTEFFDSPGDEQDEDTAA